MPEDFVFASPYIGGDTVWLRGNHHGHTILSDGQDRPEETIDAYEAAGYAYFALSEHDLFCDPAPFRDRTTMTLLPAVEVTSKANQTLMFLGAGPDLPAAGTLSLAEVERFVRERGGLFIVDHPNWLYRYGRLHAPIEELLGLDGLGAIEIYTGVIERLPGSEYATDVWDRLLSAGHRVFGHATDDQHMPLDRFMGWNAVQWPRGERPSAEGIIAALAAGRFVASTGVTIEAIGLSADRRRIEIVSDADHLRWIIAGGTVAEVTRGGSGSFALDALPHLERLAWRRLEDPGQALYVRVEAVGNAGRRAWSQPFFIEAHGGANQPICQPT